MVSTSPPLDGSRPFRPVLKSLFQGNLEKSLLVPAELAVDIARLEWEFGTKAITELARTASLAGLQVFERGSLKATPDGVRFTFRNPPLRMGAFSAIRVFWDRQRVPDADVTVQVRGSPPPTSLAKVKANRPFTVPVGQRTDFVLRLPTPAEGAHRLRLELQSVAIPPMVFWESMELLSSRF